MNSQKALQVFGVDKIPELSDLKSLYRRLSLVCHPDRGGSHERFVELQNAYDILSQTAEIGLKYQHIQSENIAKWRKVFEEVWRSAYAKAKADQSKIAGLHFSTCIEDFRRGYIYPPREWFYRVLFGDQDKSQEYREFLLKVAPNSLFREAYARKYWELECQGKWVFYLPPRIEQLRSEKFEAFAEFAS
jgi:curved DNA-binding protein CbpA